VAGFDIRGTRLFAEERLLTHPERWLSQNLERVCDYFYRGAALDLSGRELPAGNVVTG